MPDAPVMTFQRFGRSHHLRIETARDLELALRLDEPHWVATGAPIGALNCDPTFLRLMDTDHNGRIMCHEVKEGIRWLLATLRSRKGIDQRSRLLRLDAIRTDEGEGQRIHLSTSKILRRLELSDSDEVTLEQVRQVKAQVEGMPVSEAGVVLPEAAGSAEIRQFITDILASVGGAPHPGGAQGVGVEQLEKFLSVAAAAVEWHQRGQVPPGADKTEVLPLGERTAAACEVLAAIRGKVDQYFAQCEALALDERFARGMGSSDEEVQGLNLDDPAEIQKLLAAAPLAPGRADRLLPFDANVNPHYATLLERLRREVCQPALGGPVERLSSAQWQQVKAFFAAHQAWAAAAPDPKVQALGADKLRAYLQPQFAEALHELIADSRRTAFDLDNLRLAEKLILYQAYMIDFANNFVSFPHLYDPGSRAMFERGSLVMDGRRFNLAVLVEDRKKHANIARTSNMCLLYVEVAPRDGPKPYEVAVPVTSGGIGNLCVQKRGIFCDELGRECDAVVVDIIENPISLHEALVSPFQRLGRLLTGKIESLTTQAEKKLDQQAAGTLDQVAAPAKGAKASPGPSGGMLMGLGVAGAAVGSALAYIAKTLSEEPLAVVIGLLAAILLVLLPTSIVAWLKLRRRDLSAILEGSGWGINSRMRLTRRQSRYFTQRPWYPRDARGVSRIPWGALVALGIVLAILLGGAELLRRHLRSGGPTSQPAGGKAPAASPGK
jgi:hypothetical protein